ncbi:MAG: hypothetical protein L6R39_000059 [Caloplaca ligustica]|nr:MAG: hypothetical protein L6R39_000059 [Caloplaca ligustica]
MKNKATRMTKVAAVIPKPESQYCVYIAAATARVTMLMQFANLWMSVDTKRGIASQREQAAVKLGAYDSHTFDKYFEVTNATATGITDQEIYQRGCHWADRDHFREATHDRKDDQSSEYKCQQGPDWTAKCNHFAR